jgi:large subunit ribosomal protein L18
MKRKLKVKFKIKRRKERVHKKMREIALLSNKFRLVVSRSNKYIYGQVIDDRKGITLASASSLEIRKNEKGLKKAEEAKKAGLLLAERALKANVKEVVFDRGKYKYHGRVKAFAEGAREGGLIF